MGIMVLKKLFPVLAFSVLLLIPIGYQNAFAQSQTCTLINFEGEPNNGPAPIVIGDATFTGTVASLVDSDAGGTGNFANEPSPETVIAFGSLSSIITLTFANPVSQVSWFYSANGQTELRFFDSGNGLLTTINPRVLSQGGIGGDPTGFFDNWIMASHSEVSNTIKKIEMDIASGSVVMDDFEFCIIDSQFVGGTPIPIDTTMILLGATETTASWIIPVIVAGIGIAIVIARKF